MAFKTVNNDENLQKLLKDIFTDDFMQQHTHFTNFDAFCYSSAVIVNWKRDPMVYNEELLDRFVHESTQFSSWDEMVRIAADMRYGTNAK